MEVQIKETCLYVKDLSLSESFYSEKLNFKLIRKAENRHLFYCLGNTMLLLFNPEATRSDIFLPIHYAYGRTHVAFEVKLNEYEDWKNFIKSRKIEIIDEQSWNKDLKSFYFRDPDGHLLEIVPEGLWKLIC